VGAVNGTKGGWSGREDLRFRGEGEGGDEDEARHVEGCEEDGGVQVVVNLCQRYLVCVSPHPHTCRSLTCASRTPRAG
jgi:hypothetical protein